MSQIPQTNGIDSPSYLEDASGFHGHAERIFFPRDETDVAEILELATRDGIGVTISGAGTGVSGGRVPQGGWAVAMNNFSHLSVESGIAVVGAGVSLHELHAAAAKSGQFYPPDPTETSASIGGTLGTNASGSRSYRYGDTRKHVLGLQVILATGKTLNLRRGDRVTFPVPEISSPRSTKNSAGYYLRPGMDWIDLFVGSEGTLGVITQAELRLLPLPHSVLGGVIFFASDAQALRAVDAWRTTATPRMIEYLDRGSLNILRTRFPEIPASAEAVLLIEQELAGDDDIEIGHWFERIEAAHALTDHCWFGTSAVDRERFRAFRHSLPELVNDSVRRSGCLKMASDCAVPVEHNQAMLDFYRRHLEEQFPDRYVIFGHIGDAHLHVNILPLKEDVPAATAILIEFARKAVSLGGSVSAEHGIGKRKANLLAIQFSANDINSMRAVKRRLDPASILGRGTLWADD